MAKHKLGSKHFFTLVVLSVAALGTMFMAAAVQQPTSTQSEATGASGFNLSQCTQLGIESGKPNRNYGGGIQLFNKDGQTGGDRVFCVVKRPGDTNVQGDPNLSADNRVPNEQKYQDVWGGFNYKTNSFSLRVDNKCMLTARLYDSKANYEENRPFAERKIINNYSYSKGPITKHYQLSKENVDRTAAIKLILSCSY